MNLLNGGPSKDEACSYEAVDGFVAGHAVPPSPLRGYWTWLCHWQMAACPCIKVRKRMGSFRMVLRRAAVVGCTPVDLAAVWCAVIVYLCEQQDLVLMRDNGVWSASIRHARPLLSHSCPSALEPFNLPKNNTTSHWPSLRTIVCAIV